MAKAKNQPLKSSSRHWPKVIFLSLVIVFVLLFGAVALVRRVYISNLSPISNNQTVKHVTIVSGSSVAEIADLLAENNLIRGDWAFEWYVRSKELRDSLQAGTYAFKESQSVPEIVEMLRTGEIDRDLVTILPGKRLDQIKESFIKEAGFSEASVNSALDPARYKGHPALSDKPASASLEGYLYPESFQKTAETLPQYIIEQSLDQMATKLTPDRRARFAARSLSVHQAVIMASIVEQEVSEPEERSQVAQVFYSRLREGMRLESDPTIRYGDPAYDTYEIDGLPPGPISNVSESSLEAVANPSATDWFFFVAGKDCVTRFSRTNAEHDQLKQRYGVRQPSTVCP